jgi:hypothetical protein
LPAVGVIHALVTAEDHFAPECEFRHQGDTE